VQRGAFFFGAIDKYVLRDTLIQMLETIISEKQFNQGYQKPRRVGRPTKAEVAERLAAVEEVKLNERIKPLTLNGTIEPKDKAIYLVSSKRDETTSFACTIVFEDCTPEQAAKLQDYLVGQKCCIHIDPDRVLDQLPEPENKRNHKWTRYDYQRALKQMPKIEGVEWNKFTGKQLFVMVDQADFMLQRPASWIAARSGMTESEVKEFESDCEYVKAREMLMEHNIQKLKAPLAAQIYRGLQSHKYEATACQLASVLLGMDKKSRKVTTEEISEDEQELTRDMMGVTKEQKQESLELIAKRVSEMRKKLIGKESTDNNQVQAD
jgi:hypothetical protein